MKEQGDAFDLFACADLDRDKIQQLALQTGFCQRDSGKIRASDFLVHLCLESVSGTVSYNDLAARVQAQTGISASRQAYWERTDDHCLRFFQSVLEHIMLSKCAACDIPSGRFKRILLQDSTVIKLPLRLFEVFSGVRNAHTAVCNARIQGIYDLIAGHFIQFSIDPYSKNDRAAAWEIPAQEGDLILRDRGYFIIPAIEEHKRAGADSIQRYCHPTLLYESVGGQKINLFRLLARNDSVDIPANIGPEQTCAIRLIALPVPEETANLRRMKAKKEMKGHAPSKEILKLMSWTIFLTTLTDSSISSIEIAQLYGLRWRIENIFKTWKSHFNFQKVHNVHEIQLRVLLNARLIMITLAYERLFLPLSCALIRMHMKPLSLIKFMRYVVRNLEFLLRHINAKTPSPKLCETLARFCAYEKRHRTNFVAQMGKIILKMSAASA